MLDDILRDISQDYRQYDKDRTPKYFLFDI